MKKTVSLIADYIFWYLLYALPLLVLLLSVYRTGEIVALSTVFSDLQLFPTLSNFFYSFLTEINQTIFPMFETIDMLLILSYYCSVLTMHLIVDILLFIIKWGHHFIDKSCRRFHE